MIRKYIKGDFNRANEVIAELEKLGGVNFGRIVGANIDAVYYINENSVIMASPINTVVGKLIQECFEEIILPPAFVSKEITFYTEPSSTCEGCYFEKCITRVCAEMRLHPECLNGNFIYKRKK